MTGSRAGEESPDDRLTDLVSVVVCAKDRAGTIADALQSIVANRPHEIIVIDDQSQDGTGEVARRFTDRVVRSQGKGLGAARQLGAEQARCRYVAYVDSDIVLSKGCLAALTAVLEEDRTVACASATTWPAGPRSRWARAGREVRALVRPPRTGRVRSLGVRASMIRRELLLESGFDTFFVGAAEDEDLAARLQIAGWHFHRSEASAEHRHGSTLWGLFRHRMWYGRGSERLTFKHAALGIPRQVDTDPPSALSGRSLLVRFVRQRRFDMAMYVLASSGGFRLGQLLERFALRNTRYPGGG
jgi:glycosyltransferase involved in cell wall biosynthesis